jgi:hypothetical protein
MDKIIDRNDISTATIKRTHIDIADLIAVGVRTPGWEDEFHFMRVPRKAPADATSWKLVLAAMEGQQRLLPLEVAGDAVLGTSLGSIETNADVDLCLWDAQTLGVSRHHLRLRPNGSKLFAMDLGSKNGSHINGMELSPSHTVVLNHGDYLSMGNLHMRVFILAEPGKEV